MKSKLLVPGLMLLASCHPGPKTDDPELLKKTLTGYFDGIAQKDTAKMRALTTDDFVLYESGAKWNNDSAFKNIRAHLPFTVQYRLGDLRIHADEQSGDIVYTNHADFVFHDSVNLSLDWLESATFRKTDQGWKMNFLHVTLRDPRYDTIRYAQDHYDARVKQFATEPMSTGKLLFLGNSITEFGDWKTLTGDAGAVNRGIAADNTYGVLGRLTEVIARKPRKLVLEIGINDIGQDIPVSVIESNIFGIVANIKTGSPGTQVYVVSVLPSNDQVKDNYPMMYGKNGLVDQLDYNLKRDASGFVFIDLKRWLSDENGDLDRKYAKPDGLHLNAEGYKVWIGLLKKAGCL